MSKSNENERTDVRRRGPTLPTLDVRRMAMLVVISTLLAGQANILDELGVYADMADLYEIAVLMLFLWAFWSQINYALARGAEHLAAYLENRGGESDV